MNKQRKLVLGCAIYVIFGVIITTLYFSMGGDLFRSYFDWKDLFDFFN
ncbi:hypothetical protein [Alkalibacillus aidingensis]|nr:hypothetical protein [Alkalibacillus aidingensis]